MKKIIRLLAAAFLIIAFALPARAEYIHVDFLRYDMSSSTETAWMKGYDTSGNQLWYYQCSILDKAELPIISWIGVNNGLVYFVEDGDIVALDLETGYEKWRNSDFGGSPAEKAFVFSSSGKLYISGWYGPDFFVVDTNGRTVALRQTMTNGRSYWPSKMEFLYGDMMRITYDSDDSHVDFDVTDYFN